MLDAVRNFARKVLLLHAVLLLIVLAIVALGAREIYQRAREHAILETRQRQELLATETATGIEAYYMGIIEQLEKLQRKEEPAATEKADDHPAAEPPPAPERPARPARQEPPPFSPRIPGQRNRERGVAPALIDSKALMDRSLRVDTALTAIMWKLLQDHVAFLFVLDPANQQVVQNQAFPREDLTLMRQIARDNNDFLKDLQEPRISSFIQPEGGQSGHLIAVPATAGVAMGDRTLVAFVPVAYTKAKFFDPLNNDVHAQQFLNASLLDKQGDAIVSLNTQLVGKNLFNEITDPELKADANRYVVQGNAGSWTVDRTSQIGDVTLPPRILAAEPVFLPGRRWTVVISTPIAATENVIRPIFDSAILWAFFFALAVAALLASTSFFMIRGRVKYERARHAMLSRQISEARQIQLAWLPDGNDVPAGLQISAANLPANHISGDFYNWFPLPDPHAPHLSEKEIDLPAQPANARIAVVIGDVTGHGMSAAFLMATTQLLVRTTLMRHQDPGRCLTAVNRELCAQGFRGQFVTMIVMILDPKTSSIEIAVAGHPAPLVEQNGKFKPLAIETHLVLGVDTHEHYRTQGFLVEPGGSVLMYTDGVIEAERPDGEQFGLPRLLAALGPKTGEAEHPDRRIQTVLEEVKKFCTNADLHDDLTLVAVRPMPESVELFAASV